MKTEDIRKQIGEIRIIIVFLILNLTFYFLFPTSISAFDAFTSSPEIIAVGGSIVAASNDQNSLFNGIAGACRMKKPGISASYALPFYGLDDDSINQSYIGIVYPLKFGVFNFAWGNMNADIYSENAILFGYSRNIGNDFDFFDADAFMGIDIKYLKKNYETNRYTMIDPVFTGGNDAGALTFDLSFQQEIMQKLRIGVSIENITKPDLGLSGEDSIERIYRGGIAFVKPAGDFYKWVELSAEINGGDFFGHLGGQYPLKNGLLILRTGYEFGSEKVSNLSIGFGLNFINKKMALDYAFKFSTQDAGLTGSHYTGLSWQF